MGLCRHNFLGHLAILESLASPRPRVATHAGDTGGRPTYPSTTTFLLPPPPRRHRSWLSAWPLGRQGWQRRGLPSRVIWQLVRQLAGGSSPARVAWSLLERAAAATAALAGARAGTREGGRLYFCSASLSSWACLRQQRRLGQPAQCSALSSGACAAGSKPQMAGSG